jgi:hypothetical protein
LDRREDFEPDGYYSSEDDAMEAAADSYAPWIDALEDLEEEDGDHHD